MPKGTKKAGTASSKKKGGSTSASRSQGMQLRKQSAPVASGSQVATGSAKFQNLGTKGDIRVSHSEYVTTIPGSVLFAATQYQINPGNPVLFPWLSQIATRFESYSFNSLTIRLLTRAPTSIGGVQVLTVDYDAADASPQTMAQARSYRSAVAGAPWEDISFTASKEDLHKQKSNFVRTGVSLPTGTDIRLYDIGELFVITEGQAATTVISELVVSYDITLMTPQLSGFDGLCTRINGGSALTASVLFGTSPTADAQGSLPFTFVGNNTVVFQTAGTYLVQMYLTGTVMVATSIINGGTVTSGAGLVAVPAAATSAIGWTYLTVLPGQTWIPSITSATTVVTSQFSIASFDPHVVS